MVREFLFTSRWGRWWWGFQALVSLGATANFVALTYYAKADVLDYFSLSSRGNPREAAVAPLVIFDLVVTALFFMDYCLLFYTAEDRLKFFFKVYSLCDLVTIVPVGLFAFFTIRLEEDQLLVVYFLRLASAARIFRIYRFLSFADSEEKRQLFTFVLSIVGVLFIGASSINVLETFHAGNPSQPDLKNWHDSFYYMLVSFSTIGFGDLVPTTTLSRATVMVMIVVVIFLVPYQSAKIAQIYNMRSPYHSATYKKKHNHVILAGVVNYNNIVDFCREFFAISPDDTIVILSADEPDLSVRKLLRNPFYASRLTYLAGSPLNRADLTRAKVQEANALFLLNAPELTQTELSFDAELKHARATDATILMMVLAVKTDFPCLPVFAQVQDVRTKDLAMDCGSDRVLCVEELKMAIFARCAVYPGITTLITNLVHTFSNLEEPLSETWLNEYLYGGAHQVYSFEFPDAFLGCRFMDLVPMVYEIYGVTIFAVSSWENNRNEYRVPKIFTPDGAYKIRSRDLGFAIALDGDIVDLIHQYTPEPEARSMPWGSLSRRFSEKSDNSVLTIASSCSVAPAPPVLPSWETNRTVQFATPPLQLPQHPQQSQQPQQAQPEGTLYESTRSRTAFSAQRESWRVSESGELPADVSGHVILCGSMNPRGIRHFLESLRRIDTREGSPQGPPVVLLIENIPRPEAVVWREVFAFPDVYFVEGIPLRRLCLLRAGVERCSRLVVFPAGQNSAVAANSALMDSNAIFVCKMVQAEWPHVPTLVELLEGNNVAYVSPQDPAWHDDVQKTRCVIGDYALNVEQRLESYQSRRKVRRPRESDEVLRKVAKIAGSDNSGIGLYPHYQFDRYFASGQVYVSSFMDSLLCQAYIRPYVLAASVLLARNLVQQPIPDELVNRRYVDLVQYYCARHVVPVGLYRRGAAAASSSYASIHVPPLSRGSSSPYESRHTWERRNTWERRKSSLKPSAGKSSPSAPSAKTALYPYVYTNCRASDRVFAGDMVFLLKTQ